MKFYFCETCGRRLTEDDISRGQGRDKKLKGIFCTSCAVGVMTQEMQAVDEPALDAGTPIKHEPSAAPRTNRDFAAKSVAESPRAGRVPVGKSVQERNSIVPVAAAIGAVIVVACVVLALGGSSKKTEIADKSKEKPKPKLIETPAPDPVAILRPAPAPPDVKPETKSADPLPDAPARPVDREELAQRAMDKMNAAFKELPSEDKDGRVALAKAFIKDYDDTIVSSRVRVMLKQWTDPPPPMPVTATNGKTAALPNGGKSLASLSQDVFTGGCPQINFWNQGRTGRSIWGKKSSRGTMKAPFTLDKVPEGATSLVVNSLRHERQEPCQFLIKINDVEIFKGVDPADTWVWTDHAFSIPAGILKAGKNEVYFENLEPDGYDSRIPWYMIYTVQVVETPGK